MTLVDSSCVLCGKRQHEEKASNNEKLINIDLLNTGRACLCVD